MKTVTVEIPPRDAGANQILFRREFLRRIRSAISQAQINGELDAETAVECFKALPPATSDERTA